MNNDFSFKRFWCLRSGTISLNDQGFFLDPESEYAHFYNKDIFTFDRIRSTPCLIFLGEPGSGKTTALRYEIQHFYTPSIDNKDICIYKDLNEYCDEIRIIRDLFETPVFIEWLNGSHQLHLFLDSFDECIIEVPKLAAILQNQLKNIKHNLDRLNLRIVCRTGDWPESLTSSFNALWGNEKVGVYELAPLRRKDVFEAAKALGLNADIFIKIIKEKELQPLASNPITLPYLLTEFKNNQILSKTRSELFLNGCMQLCVENNSVREPDQRNGALSPMRRLALASRIAAVMVFCNRSSISSKSNFFDLDETRLTLSMLQEGEETTGNYSFNFTENDLRETLKRTSLFSGRGPDRFGFSHQSYAEYLAARYLAIHQLNIQQIKSLVQLSNYPDQMVIPQLKETTAWLNFIVPEMIKDTIKCDPQSVLVGDIESLESIYRRDLVESLLKQFELLKISDGDWGRYSQYQKLKHPELANQLKPYIEDKSKHFLVRRVAIDIAEACETRELQSILTDIALDGTDALHIRSEAAHAIASIADDKTKLRLAPLALKPLPEDTEDEIKGSALQALWPDLLSIQDLFNSLTLPKRENLFGSYANFLTELPDQIKTEDLPIALKWASKNPGDGDRSAYRYENLTENILFRAWHHLENDEVLNSLAEAIIPRLEHYFSICPIPRYKSEGKIVPPIQEELRKKLIRAVVSIIPKYRNFLFTSGMDQPELLNHHDLVWLLDEFQTEKNKKKKIVWLEILNDIYDINRSEHFNKIYYAMPFSKLLREKFKGYYEAIALDSPLVQTYRDQYEKHLKWEKDRQQRKVDQNKKLKPSVLERITACLDRFETGDTSAWWQMCREMTLEDTSKYYGSELGSDLVGHPGWKVCDDILKERIVNAAKIYIDNNDAAASKWLGTNTYYRPATAGYKAFILLKKLDPDYLNTLPGNIWKKWAPVIIGYPETIGIAGRDITFMQLIKDAYKNAPNEIFDALLVLIDKENADHDSIFITQKIEDCLDEFLQISLLTKIKTNTLKPSCMQNILSMLIKAKHEKSIKYAKSLISEQVGGSETQKNAEAAALALITNADDAGWDSVWVATSSNVEFGKNVFLALPNSFRYRNSRSLPDCIGEKCTAELYIWLNQHFPRDEDPKAEGAHFVGPRESLAHFRDGLLEYLKFKGTREAIDAFEKIKKELPALEFINFYLIGARENLRRINWIPLTPEDFILLTKKSSSRLILSADHLIDALMESLTRLEQKLQGETPNSIFLWDSIPKLKKLRPKTENQFSDFVKTHLVEDLKESGIIALREVEIRSRHGEDGNPGERTDIYVSGYIPSKKEHVRVIIEVKGCWHDEVNHAIETQLFQRYLNESGCDHGIYLVGWFCCKQWDGNDW